MTFSISRIGVGGDNCRQFIEFEIVVFRFSFDFFSQFRGFSIEDEENTLKKVDFFGGIELYSDFRKKKLQKFPSSR